MEVSFFNNIIIFLPSRSPNILIYSFENLMIIPYTIVIFQIDNCNRLFINLEYIVGNDNMYYSIMLPSNVFSSQIYIGQFGILIRPLAFLV